ncbi:MAG TPA: ABC transporter permease [Bryobacteraceae bacterium]|nr:ABC transporter permease [Bryobacteraceae bacterium]
MKERVRDWLDETHGPGLELVRHFIARFFDSEMVATPGEWTKVAAGAFAALISVGVLILPLYWQRYHLLLSDASSPLDYRQGVRDDISTFVAVAMWATTLLTAIQWQSLFPSLRDCLALASLPVKPLQIFRAKFSALLLMFTTLALTLAVPASLVFTAASAGRWRENPSVAINFGATFLAIAGGCAFVFFALVALQGMMLNLLPARWFGSVSTAVQGSVCILTLGVLPFLGKQLAGPAFWPPNWFLGLWTGAIGASDAAPRTALLAMGLAPAITLLSYFLSYHRYRRLLLESPAVRARRRWDGLGSRLLELWIPDPREQAAFAFIWKSLVRSRNHRLVLLVYGGVALGCILNGLSGSSEGLLHASTESMRHLMVLAPLTVCIFVVAALRYLFSLPVELRANWIFRTNEKAGRAAWFRAVARLVIALGIVPVFVAAFPPAVTALGFARACKATALGLTLSLAVFEAIFRTWRKLPFTCSYLPGKRSLLATLRPYLMGIPALAAVGELFFYSLEEPTAFLAVEILLAAAWWRMRQARIRAWARTALCYEEAREPDVMTLSLESGRDSKLDRGAPIPAPAHEMFSDSMVASRGSDAFAWMGETGEGAGVRFWFETLLEDLRYGLRLIRRSALLSAVLVLTLTLGIGLNVGIFTLIDAVTFRARVDHPENFVTLVPSYTGSETFAVHGATSPADYLVYRERSRTLSSVVARVTRPVTIGDDDPGSWAALVSCNFFPVYGLPRAKVGRLFLPSECAAPGGAPVAVIAEELWRDRFGSDPEMVGKIIRVNDRAFTVVGIAPARFAGHFFRAVLWIPYTAQPYLEAQNMFAEPQPTWVALDGRLAPGVSRVQAQAELSIIARQLDQLHSDRKTKLAVTNGSLLSALVQKDQGPEAYWLLACIMGALSLVLLITCANVTTLLLSKAMARQREIAVRLSMGAARVRLLRMLLTETLLIAGLAGAASIWVAYRMPPILYQFIAKQPPDFSLAPDWWIFAYAAGAVLLTGVAAGLAPAVESLKVDLASAMKGSAGATRAAGGTPLHRVLVTAQVALSLVLLAAAGFAGQAYWHVAGPNYPTRNILVVPLRFPPRNTYAQSRAEFRRVAQQVQTLPGVDSVTYAGQIPLLLPNIVKVRFQGQPADTALPVNVQDASPGYFRTMGIPLVSGREFRDSDVSNNQFYVPAIVSESFVRAFGFHGDPTGQHFVAMPETTVEVIGVAKDVAAADYPDTPVAYTLSAMAGDRTFALVHFGAPAQQFADTVRARIASVDPSMVISPRTLQSFIDDAAEDVWRVVELVLTLGLTAFALATTGIYGAVAFTVTQKTRDLGIRVALGAQRVDIWREVFLSGGKPVAQGLGVGLWLAFVGAAAIRQAFRFTPIRLDTGSPMVYIGAVLLLTVAALLAMLGPARRASGTDPLDALRSE